MQAAQGMTNEALQSQLQLRYSHYTAQVSHNSVLFNLPTSCTVLDSPPTPSQSLTAIPA